MWRKSLGQLPGVKVTETNLKAIQGLLPAGAVHQGVALKTMPLPEIDLETWLADSCPDAPDPVCLVVLDQVRDPHNIGAIMRSAAAFGAAAILMPRDNAPQESSVIAKSASGALELMPWLRVTNLARGLELLKENSIWCLGFDGEAQASLNTLPPFPRVACIFGSEGKGLRPNTIKHSDLIVKIPMSGHVESLNVSNAVAVALYALCS